MKDDRERMFVSKQFKTFFKIKAARENMSMIKYSKLIAENPNKLLQGERTIVKTKKEGGKVFESIF